MSDPDPSLFSLAECTFSCLRPTAPCGPDFDQILDDKIGYLDFTVDQDTDVSQANGAWGDFFGTDDEPDSTVARRALARRTLSRGLVKREDCAWYDAPCYARKLVKVIVQAPAAIVEKTKDLGTQLVNAAVDVGTGIYNGAKAAVSISPIPRGVRRMLITLSLGQCPLEPIIRHYRSYQRRSYQH